MAAGAEQEREDRGDAAAFFRDAPTEVQLALARRLSTKLILRARAVCRAWRDVLSSDSALLHMLHPLQPARPLLCFDRAACPARQYFKLRDYCVESLDLRSGELRPVLRFADNEYYGYADTVGLRGHDDAPPITRARCVDFKKMEDDYADDVFVKPKLVVHGSLHGYLLVSFVDSWYLVSPATRLWAALPDLSSFGVVGLYYHAPSDTYRVLCLRISEVVQEASTSTSTSTSVQCSYFVHALGGLQMRGIGLGRWLFYACIYPPLQLGRNLHWPPVACPEEKPHIVVFDTEAEVFRRMRSPPPVNMTLRGDGDATRLLELPPGLLGLSAFRKTTSTLELWRLEDYQREGWVLVHRIRLALQQIMPILVLERHWAAAVVSPEGDVLIESTHWLLHCDREGNLLRKFRVPGGPMARHVFRESLLRHHVFRERIVGAPAPPFFRGLSSDPSW
ncbi:hypothetical protein BS78_06G029900 [Paspalum vaginatum]|nr:hypothetical protein BS78_06G029900 [Paspalum vaginatum]